MAFIDQLHNIRKEQEKKAAEEAAAREANKDKWIFELADKLVNDLFELCTWAANNRKVCLLGYLYNYNDSIAISEKKPIVRKSSYGISDNVDNGNTPLWLHGPKTAAGCEQALNIVQTRLRAEGFKSIELKLVPCYKSKEVTKWKGLFATTPVYLDVETPEQLGYNVWISLGW